MSEVVSCQMKATEKFICSKRFSYSDSFFIFPNSTALFFSFSFSSLFGSSSRIRDCRAVKWEKKHVPEAQNILSSVEKAFRRQQLYRAERTSTLRILPQRAVAMKVIGVFKRTGKNNRKNVYMTIKCKDMNEHV